MVLEAQAAGFLACFARASAWAFAAPLLGQSFVPSRVRVILAGSVALLVAPVRPPLGYGDLLAVLPFEILFGLMAGAAARFVIAGAEAGGQIIGIQLGLGFAGAFDPLAGEQSLPTRRLVFVMAGLAFLGLGGFEAAIRTMALPAPDAATTVSMLGAIIESTDVVFEMAVRLAAPFLIAGFIANLAMALVSKASAGLNVFSVMLALFLTVGFIILVTTSSSFINDMTLVGRMARDSVWGLLNP